MKYLTHFLFSAFALFILKAPIANAQFKGIYENCPNVAADPQKDDLACVVQWTIGYAAYIVGAILVVMIVIAGIMYVTSMGNPDRVALAKKTLVGAIIGLIIVVLSAFMVNVLTSLF
ncbi:hypothetical protein C4544_00215 [candidate division WS5 bacterium]|uniref:DUF4134 domain-containing protein n=1 Tax=candidate division WS5 bacterium TaxID=2093353 RepID=A0A419DGL9_9BACT|nr:MAG: hypothetical protein C4544_00215 [candidate division WS5 bacterium]